MLQLLTVGDIVVLIIIVALFVPGGVGVAAGVRVERLSFLFFLAVRTSLSDRSRYDDQADETWDQGNKVDD